MATISPTQVYKIIDLYVKMYNRLLGTTASGLGAGDGTFGASYIGSDIRALIEGSSDVTFADADIQIALAAEAKRLVTRFDADVLIGSAGSQFIAKLSSLSAAARTVSATIRDLDSYMEWFNWNNGSTYWQCLAPPEWYDIFYALRTSHPSKRNMYHPVMEGGTVRGTTYTNALYKVVLPGPTNTDGGSVDYTLFQGGYAYVKWTGGTGAGACSITVTGKNQSNEVETWTLSGTWGVGAFTATQTGYLLTPLTANSLITDVTGVVITGMTGGTLYFEARPPSGRTYPL